MPDFISRPLIGAAAALLCLGGAVVPAVGARADDKGNISVKLLDAPTDRRDDPRAMKYIVDHLAPGTKIQRRIQVSNPSPHPQTFDVYPAAASIDGQQFQFAGGQTPNELTSWITLDHNRVDLAPDEDIAITATIDVPRQASQGERYAVIWASTSSASPATGSVTQISRVGVRVYLDVGPGGEPAADFSIGAFTTARSDSGMPTLIAEVHNTGGRALDMVGDLNLTDGPAGTTAGPYDVVRGTTLAPGASGTIAVTPPRDLANGPWTAHLRLSSGRVEHEATAIITFPSAGEAPNRFTALFAGNRLAQIIGAAGVVAILAIAGLFFWIRRSRKLPTA